MLSCREQRVIGALLTPARPNLAHVQGGAAEAAERVRLLTNTEARLRHDIATTAALTGASRCPVNVFSVCCLVILRHEFPSAEALSPWLTNKPESLGALALSSACPTTSGASHAAAHTRS